MKSQWIKIGILMASTALLASACVTGGGYKPVGEVAALQVAFADPAWNGEKVPDGMQCGKFGGKGATPSLVVGNIPAGANAVILAFNDKSYMPMDNGCHGTIGYMIPAGATEATIPSVPGHTFELPPGFFLVKAHCNPRWDKAGAYMPPCSGGKGNLYTVTVQAVYKPANKDEQGKLLGQAEVKLGRY